MGFFFDLRKAIFHDTGDNETALDGVGDFDDPVKHRLGATVARIYGIVSGDRLVGTRRKERVMLQLRENDRHPGQDGGQFRFLAQRPGTEDDANMIPLLDLDTDRAVFHVPVEGISGGGGLDFLPRMISPNQRYIIQIQNDGHICQYDTQHSQYPAAASVVWSNWYGMIRPLPWT